MGVITSLSIYGSRSEPVGVVHGHKVSAAAAVEIAAAVVDGHGLCRRVSGGRWGAWGWGRIRWRRCRGACGRGGIRWQRCLRYVLSGAIALVQCNTGQILIGAVARIIRCGNRLWLIVEQIVKIVWTIWALAIEEIISNAGRGA